MKIPGFITGLQISANADPWRQWWWPKELGSYHPLIWANSTEYPTPGFSPNTTVGSWLINQWIEVSSLIIFLKIYLLFWKSRVTEETRRKRDLLSSGSLPKLMTSAGWGWCQELDPGLPHVWQGPKHMDHLSLLFPGH